MNVPLIFTFVILRIVYIEATAVHLKFMLRPISSLVAIFAGTSFTFNGAGYFSESLNIIIDKSCSGINFMLISFVLVSFYLSKVLTKRSYKIVLIPISLLAAYLFTLLVNSSRIITSIVLENRIPNFGSHLLHIAYGVFIYIFNLILLSVFLEKVINKRIRNNEKLS